MSSRSLPHFIPPGPYSFRRLPRPRAVSYFSFETVDQEHAKGASGEAATIAEAQLPSNLAPRVLD